jgi:hypothetical protein
VFIEKQALYAAKMGFCHIDFSGNKKPDRSDLAFCIGMYQTNILAEAPSAEPSGAKLSNNLPMLW